MAGLIRVTALAATRRRAGFAFSRTPLVIGPESLGVDIAAPLALAAIVSDPALLVECSDEDAPDVFVAISETERDAIIDMATAAELAADDEEARDAIARIVERLLGERSVDPELAGVGLLTGGGDMSMSRAEPIDKTELQSPDEAGDEGKGAAAPEPDATAKAEAGVNAAPAVETPPASPASAADDEQSRAGADASGAAPAADADAGNQPEATRQPPVSDGATPAAAPAAGTVDPAAAPAAEAANPAAAAPAAPATPEPKKGAAVPAKAKAKAVAKPQGSSGRKPAADANAAKG